MRRGPLLLLVGVLLALPRVSRACASCGCGDPTLTVMGSEKPLALRLRAGLLFTQQGEQTGTPGRDALELGEQRAELNVAFAPHPRVFLLFTVPIVRRTVQYANLAGREVRGVADPELWARVLLWEDRPFAARHLLWLLAGARVSLTPTARDGVGVALPAELQLGSGTVAPLGGLAYGHFHFPWSEYASVQGMEPIGSRAGARPGRSLRLNATAQRQLGQALAVRVGLDTRLDGQGREHQAPDPHSGGAITFLSPELLLAPMEDLVIYGGVRVPLAAALRGAHRERAIWSAGVMYDF